MDMDNPWINLPNKSPFVIADDGKAIDSYNFKNKQSDYEIKTGLFPEPYIGSLNASVVFLSLNPGYSGEVDDFHFKGKYFQGLCRSNLLHRRDKYPFYYFNPKLYHTNGHKWWKQKLKELISEVGIEAVASEVFVLEYFPYHSKRFKPIKELLASQYYNVHLLKEIVKQGKIIIIMRAERYWLELLPELRNYDYYKLRSSQNVVISRKNLIGDFDRIIEAVKKKKI